MKTYVGTRVGEHGCEVYVEVDGKAYPLPMRLEIRKHSPTGFEWGYGGSGPAQLALAILADWHGPDPAPKLCPYCGCEMEGWKCTMGFCGYDGERELDQWRSILGGKYHYQAFKEEVVARFPHEGWNCPAQAIEFWAKGQAQAKSEV